MPLQLTSADVPDVLPFAILEKNSVPHLKKWLQLRGIPTAGKKAQLVEKLVPFFFFMENLTCDLHYCN